MFLLCTGKQPFKRDDKIEVTPKFNLLLKLADYSDSATFADMVDFLRKLMVVDVDNRLTAAEALNHPWLNALPY